MKTRLGFVLSLGMCLGFAACGPSNLSSKPLVRNVAVRDTGIKPGVNHDSHSVNVSITVDKDAIFGQEFLYEADLQYSDYHDPGDDLENQSMAIGDVPVKFRIAGNELELIADNRRLSASDVNHPELLISRYKILSQTATTLTISGANSSVFLGEVFDGTKEGGNDTVYNPNGTPPRESWIRSFDYVRNGNYMLQQTSIVTSSGNMAEFMESVFPRSTLAPGPDFQKFAMDPSSNIGMTDPFYSRFRFLPGETIYDPSAGTSSSGDPKQVAYAAHFDISPQASGAPGTIDWYVTRNIPDSSLPAVQEAVEGWNRYFLAEKGVARAVMQFKGRLPEGIHIGDPRYNVINWDSKRVAGAAYETQATDPDTGKQSHSLIYMPAAWLQIGLNYYKSGISADLQSRSLLSRRIGRSNHTPAKVRLGCMRDMTDAIALIGSGRLSREDVKKYATELLKQTLFHELGHSLGLAHNFKGSLSYDPSSPHPIFSTSIMDYNDYEIERAAFNGVNTWKGPLLEYDRQAIDALYNRGRDISSSDPKVPVCNDAEADQEKGGVDPLCIPYDIEKDPTHSIVTAWNRINESSLPGDVSLSEAISRIPALVLTESDIQAARSSDQVKELVSELGDGLKGALGFYFMSGKASLGKTVITNVKSLLEFEDGILPSDYNELGMRSRAFEGVQKVVAMMDLPAPVQAALAAAEKAGMARIAQAPYFASVDSKNQDLGSLTASLQKTVESFSKGESSDLASMRAQVLSALHRRKDVSYFFGTLGGKSYDFEHDLIGILLDTLDGTRAGTTDQEKVAAAKSLVTYKGRLYGDPAIDAAIKAVTTARMLAKDAKARDAAEELLGILNGTGTNS